MLLTASFFASIDAIKFGSGSMFIIFSTFIILSSAGANPSAPPHTRQAFVLSIILLISSASNSTLHILSITSAVPAAEVIALDELFGIVIPSAAHIDTTIGVVLFPAIPPMQCLSAIIFLFISSRFPVSSIASVSHFVSLSDIPTL